MTERCHRHPDGNLEEQLVADGMGPELSKILKKIGVQNVQLNNKDLVVELKRHKTSYAAQLALMIRSNPHLLDRVPKAFREAIVQFRGLA